MSSSPPSPVPKPVYPHRFTVLLGALVLVILGGPFLDEFVPGSPGFVDVGLGVLFISMLVAAAVAVSDSRAKVIVTVVLVAPATVLGVIGLFTTSASVELAKHVTAAIFVGNTFGLILVALFRPGRVTWDTIAASLCAYLLLGLVWAELYIILETVRPESFGLPAAGAGAQFDQTRMTNAIYYSFVTMTTLGYGDITPTTPVAKSAAAMQAVTGQIYMAVLVVRLVAMHIAQGLAEARGD